MSATLPPPAAPGSGRLLGPRAAPAAVLALAVAAGLLTGFEPTFGIALALGVAVAFVMVTDLAVGVALYLFITYVDVMSAEQQLSVTKAVGALLALAWLLLMTTRGRARSHDLLSNHPWLAALLVGYLAWAGLSVIWAESTGRALNDTMRFALNALVLPITFAALRERRHVVWVVSIFVIGVLISAGYGQATGTVGAGTQEGRLAGARVEANVLAALAVVGGVFAIALVATLRSPVLRVLALAGCGLCLLITFATLSRAGLLALVVATLAAVVFGGRWRRVPVILAVLAVLVGGAYLSTTSSTASERVTSANSSGRDDLWTMGWRMVQDHPVVGVGAGNYPISTIHYLVEPGAVTAGQFIVDEQYVAHNSYLSVLADLGIVGIALFAGILLYCLRCGVRAAWTFRDAGDETMEILARAVVISLVGLLAAFFFVSEQYNKQLWVLLAIPPALLALSRASSSTHPRG